VRWPACARSSRERKKRAAHKYHGQGTICLHENPPLNKGQQDDGSLPWSRNGLITIIGSTRRTQLRELTGSLLSAVAGCWCGTVAATSTSTRFSARANRLEKGEEVQKGEVRFGEDAVTLLTHATRRATHGGTLDTLEAVFKHVLTPLPSALLPFLVTSSSGLGKKPWACV